MNPSTQPTGQRQGARVLPFRHRANESAEALMLKTADLGQRWMKGVSREIDLKKLEEQPVPW